MTLQRKGCAMAQPGCAKRNRVALGAIPQYEDSGRKRASEAIVPTDVFPRRSCNEPNAVYWRTFTCVKRPSESAWLEGLGLVCLGLRLAAGSEQQV